MIISPVKPSLLIEIPERLHRRVARAWRSLEKYRVRAVTDSQLHYLLARYVFGLTVVRYGGAAPAEHLAVCRALLAEQMDEDAVEQALRVVPPPALSLPDTIYDQIESLGLRDGAACLAAEQEECGEVSAVAGAFDHKRES